MSKVKAIIFDLWETLGTKNVGISKTFRSKFEIVSTPDFLQRYENAIQLKKWESETDAAISLLSEFDIPLNEHNIAFVIDLFHQGINKATIFPGMKDLLQELSAKYKLGVLSNTTNFESAVFTKWGIDDLFSAKVFSWEVNSLKPNASNFQIICSKLNLQPSECLFIDDGQVNINATIQSGMNAKLFKGVEELRQYFRNTVIS